MESKETARASSRIPDATAINEQVDRIAADELFVRSTRMQRFLRFTTEYALSCRSEKLKEYVIGVEVFDRPRDYNPKDDGIVRGEARRLRAKLRQYYETRGRGDVIVIRYPTGSYAPQFEFRPPGARHAMAVLEGGRNRQPASRAPAVMSVAVLPFQNAAGSGISEYLRAGLAENVLNMLARVPGLTVLSSSTSFRPSSGSASEIARQLNVDAVIRADVACQRNYLRIQIELLDSDDGSRLWGEHYDIAEDQVVRIEQDIVRDLVRFLAPDLEPRLGSAMQSPGTTDTRVFHLYLKGIYLSNSRTSTAIQESIGCLEQAIAIDREYAPAYAALAITYTLMSGYGSVDPRLFMPKAEAAALRAVYLNDSLPQAHLALGMIEMLLHHDRVSVERHLKLAIKLNPNLALAHYGYGFFLASDGREAEAAAEIAKTLELDPLSPGMLANCGWIFYFSRRWDAAIERARIALDLDPQLWQAHFLTALACEQKNEYERAAQSLARASTIAGRTPLLIASEARQLALNGKCAEGRALVITLAELAATRYVPAHAMAIAYTALGATEEAFSALANSRDEPSFWSALLPYDPRFDTVRGDPRFPNPHH